MRDELTEALLENYYFAPFCEMFKTVFGLRVMRILKPSPRLDAFVGFDQGWARITVGVSEFLKELQGAVSRGDKSVSTMYFAYFLQYKCVEAVLRKSASVPPYLRPPCYRVPLSLKPNKVTAMSQHETMMRLNEIRGSEVVYACPMIFGEESLHDEPDIDDVRLVPISTAPPGFLSTEKHYVYFRDKNDPTPFWCSEPTEGASYHAREWAWQSRSKLLNSRELAKFLAELEGVFRLRKGYPRERWLRSCAGRYSHMLRIVELGHPSDEGSG